MSRSLRLLARRLPGAVATIVAVPALSYLFWTVQVDAHWNFSGASLPSPFARTWAYLKATFLHFDLGLSDSLGADPVSRVVRAGLPVDLALLLVGVTLGVAVGVAGGLLVARRPGGGPARAVRGASALAISLPVYTSGLIVLLLFAHTTGHAPIPFVSDQSDYVAFGASPLRWLRAMWVPWLVVAAPIAAACARMSTAAVREALGEDWIRAARARGVSERALVLRHALRPAALPVATLVGARMTLTVLDLAFVEGLFNLPGSFRSVRDAVSHLDLPLIQGMVLVSTALVVVSNLLAELVVLRLDPRAEP